MADRSTRLKSRPHGLLDRGRKGELMSMTLPPEMLDAAGIMFGLTRGGPPKNLWGLPIDARCHSEAFGRLNRPRLVPPCGRLPSWTPREAPHCLSPNPHFRAISGRFRFPEAPCKGFSSLRAPGAGFGFFAD